MSLGLLTREKQIKLDSKIALNAITLDFYSVGISFA